MGFDIGPANALIDAFAAGMPGHPQFDRDGEIARACDVSDDVLLSLYTLPREVDRGTPLPRAPDTIRSGLCSRATSDDDTPMSRPKGLWPRRPSSPHRCCAMGSKTTCSRDIQTSVSCCFQAGVAGTPSSWSALPEKLAGLSIRTQTLRDAWIDAKEAVGFCSPGRSTPPRPTRQSSECHRRLSSRSLWERFTTSERVSSCT